VTIDIYVLTSVIQTCRICLPAVTNKGLPVVMFPLARSSINVAFWMWFLVSPTTPIVWFMTFLELRSRANVLCSMILALNY
jgi:hypothetical protein